MLTFFVPAIRITFLNTFWQTFCFRILFTDLFIWQYLCPVIYKLLCLFFFQLQSVDWFEQSASVVYFLLIFVPLCVPRSEQSVSFTPIFVLPLQFFPPLMLSIPSIIGQTNLVYYCYFPLFCQSLQNLHHRLRAYLTLTIRLNHKYMV